MRHTLSFMATLVILLTAACSTTSDYKSYIQAQTDANRQAMEGQKPLVELIAQPGQQITGLAALRVYTPVPTPVIQQARPNEWAGVLVQTIGVAGTVLGIREAGKAAIGLADSVGRTGTSGYPYVQAPQASQTISGSGVIGTGSYATTNTATSTSQTLSGTGALNGNYTPTTTTTPTTNTTTTNTTRTSSSTVGDNSGSNSGNSGRIAGSSMTDATSTPTVVTQPEPVVVR